MDVGGEDVSDEAVAREGPIAVPADESGIAAAAAMSDKSDELESIAARVTPHFPRRVQ